VAHWSLATDATRTLPVLVDQETWDEERETEQYLIAALEARQNQGQIRIDDAALKALIEEMRDDLLSEEVAVARSGLKQLVVKLKVKNEGGTLT